MTRITTRFAWCAGLALAMIAHLGFAGCTQDRTESTAQAKEPAPRPAEPAKPMAADRAPAPSEPAAQRPDVSQVGQEEWGEQKALVIEDEALRKSMAENMIYATIRIKMEDMIEQRADLLKSGRHPTDVEVRQLEGSIMRARELLMEAGEIVEDVVPPILESTPR